MDRLIYYAIPGFVLLLVVEFLSFKVAQDDDDLVGFEKRDTQTSLTMGGGNAARAGRRPAGPTGASSSGIRLSRRRRPWRPVPRPASAG